jgi:hypothetical protein
LIFAITALSPTISPACGPPSSLSPLKVTTLAPSAMDCMGVGSAGSPQRVMSISAPLPRSSASGRLRDLHSAASSLIGTLAVKPSIA